MSETAGFVATVPTATLVIRWETALHQRRVNAAVADVAGHRLYVRRAGPRIRCFIGSIDGKTVGSWDTLNMAMGQTALQFRRRLDAGIL